MEQDGKRLIELVANHTTSPQEASELQALLVSLLQVYTTSGAKGVAQHIKESVETRQTQALRALQELQERLS